MYVYIGSLASNLAMSNVPMTPEAQIYQKFMQVIGLIATVAVTIYITKVAQKALHHSMVMAETQEIEARD